MLQVVEFLHVCACHATLEQYRTMALSVPADDVELSNVARSTKEAPLLADRWVVLGQNWIRHAHKPRAKGVRIAALSSTGKRYRDAYSTLFSVISENIGLKKFQVDAELTVEKDGRVSAAKVRLEPANPILERAFTGFATAMVFPPPCDSKQARAKLQMSFGDEPKTASTPES